MERYQTPKPNPHTYETEREAGSHGFFPPSLDELQNDPEFRKKFVKDLTLDAFLDTIDFSVLQDIFDEHVRKAGGETAVLVPKERFFKAIDQDSLGARQNSSLHVIVLNAGDSIFTNALPIVPNRTEGIKGFSMKPEAVQKIFGLSTIIHEEWHAIGGNYSFNTHFPTTAHEQTGFSNSKEYWPGIVHVKGIHLNEGFVEYMARLTLLEYVRRVGTFHDQNETDVRKFLHITSNAWNQAETYPYEVRAMKLLIAACSEILGVHEDTITEAFMRAYLRGDDIFGDELAQQFAEAGHQDTYNTIRTLIEDPVFGTTDAEWEKRYENIRDALKTIIPSKRLSEFTAAYESLEHTIANEEER